MADRAVIRTGKDQGGDITQLCNPNDWWSPVTNATAIQDIETETHRYFVPWRDGKSTWIRVVQGRSGKYLRTDKDTTSSNNLDDLADC